MERFVAVAKAAGVDLRDLKLGIVGDDDDPEARFRQYRAAFLLAYPDVAILKAKVEALEAALRRRRVKPKQAAVKQRNRRNQMTRWRNKRQKESV